jgi:hypothetical protein
MISANDARLLTANANIEKCYYEIRKAALLGESGTLVVFRRGTDLNPLIAELTEAGYRVAPGETTSNVRLEVYWNV